MKKLMSFRIVLFCVLFVTLIIYSGCYETRRHAYTERRGLMLLEKHEYARNQGAYKPSKKYKKNVPKKIKQRQSTKKR